VRVMAPKHNVASSSGVVAERGLPPDLADHCGAPVGTLGDPAEQ
jgi:hypothetical protein